MPRSHQSRYQSHRIWDHGRGGITHGPGSRLPYKERPIGSITFAALGRRNLRLRCRDCSHERILHSAALIFLFQRRGWDDGLRALPDRFWCSRCFESTGRKVKRPTCDFVDADPTGEPLPLPDERGWKRFTRRFRS